MAYTGCRDNDMVNTWDRVVQDMGQGDMLGARRGMEVGMDEKQVSL